MVNQEVVTIVDNIPPITLSLIGATRAVTLCLTLPLAVLSEP